MIPDSVLLAFGLPPAPSSFEAFGEGHIHQTYRVASPGGTLLFQRLNTTIFDRPGALMENLLRVTRMQREHLREAGVRDTERRVLTARATEEGAFLARDGAGGTWRVFDFIDHTFTLQVCSGEDDAYKAARVFGSFLVQVSRLAPGDLHDVLPRFHHAPGRLALLERAAKEDPSDRLRFARQDVAYALEQEALARIIADRLESGTCPLRVAHHDTKLNNVLFDRATREALCVVDLDTCMAGSPLFDFGDMMRTMTSPAPEDEPDLARIAMMQERLAALRDGYLETAGPILNEEEKRALPLAGLTMTHMIGVRFLTDYLLGDPYFPVAHPEHNLQRARAQFALLRSMKSGLRY